MEFFDLSMEIDDLTPVYPGDPKQEIKQQATIAKEGWNEKRLTFNSHFSTHIDVPIHLVENGKNLDDFPVGFFSGTAIVIDAFAQQPIKPDLSSVRAGDIVFFYTGHTDKYHSPAFFENNPVISKETAEELVRKKAKIVGLDSYTPDNEPFEIHKILLKENILIVENLVNLKALVGKRFECIILPLKIKDADGAPCRVVAKLD